MEQNRIRNLAIIAHVGHGKTTLVDGMAGERPGAGGTVCRGGSTFYRGMVVGENSRPGDLPINVCKVPGVYRRRRTVGSDPQVFTGAKETHRDEYAINLWQEK